MSNIVSVLQEVITAYSLRAPGVTPCFSWGSGSSSF